MAGGLSESKDDEVGVISNINVTPFVDVTLVLLVIFIVTAPALMRDTLNIRLPKASSTEASSAAPTFAIAITKQGQILLDGQLTTEENLASKARDATRANSETKAVIAADVDSKHGDLVRVIDLIKTAGLTHFGIQIQH